MGSKPKWNVASPRQYGADNDKTFWVTVGSAWENDSGRGRHDVMIKLDALPLPDNEGRVNIFLFPKDKDDERRDTVKSESTTKKGGRRAATKGDDDDIPF